MLSIASLSSAGQASSYYTKDNYYTADAAEASSSWDGKGAAELGVTSSVNVTDFAAVLARTMPDGSSIPAGPGGKHRPGIDLTFSAPKSLSLLAYIGGDERLLEANMAAARATIGWAEKNLAQTRMLDRKGALRTVKTGNLVVALFQHDTNRNLELRPDVAGRHILREHQPAIEIAHLHDLVGHHQRFGLALVGERHGIADIGIAIAQPLLHLLPFGLADLL
jgi:hypothetical protein